MKKTDFPENLCCPLDGEPLILVDKQLRCANGHSFDIARQGYVNLLPVQLKRTKQPGDNREMVEARQRFLDGGTYLPIVKNLLQLLKPLLPNKAHACILDAGCGDGYYLDQLWQSITNNPDAQITGIGVDISKPAILAAARRNNDITWIVGTNKQLPVLPASVDIILCLFGFPVWEQFAQALRPGGNVILVDAGPDHLIELRRLIYDQVRHSPPPSIERAYRQGLSLVTGKNLRFETPHLQQDQVYDLLAMTPHLYRASRQGLEAVKLIREICLSVDLSIRVLKKD